MPTNRKTLVIVALVSIVITVAIVTPIVYFTAKNDDSGGGEQGGQEGGEGGGDGGGHGPVERGRRVDCFPDMRSAAVTLTREACEQRGCHFDEEADSDPSLGVACYYPPEGGLRYSVEREEEREGGVRLHLNRLGGAPFGGDFRKPVMDVHMLSDSLLRFTFNDDYATPKRYRVPLQLQLPSSSRGDKPLYSFKITNRTKLSFVITRNSTGKVVFDTGPGGLVLSNQFLQLTTVLPSGDVYGLGEHSRTTFRRDFSRRHAWPAFARDQPPGGDNNLYGVHPFYTCVEDAEGNTHGVLMLNSNAQEYELIPGPMLTWRTIGGVLDFFIFLGPSPEQVVQQYTQLIGRPMMPPYWSLGFQLCRYGYNNLTNMQRAVEETKSYGIPQDVQYADIDHMDERKIFTIDQQNFAGLPEYFNTLRDGGMRTIIILDPCIIVNETNYEPYEKMKAEGANVMWPSNFDVPPNSSDEDGSILGFVWPKGKVVFPDFFRNETQAVWKDLIVTHWTKLAFDGIWIDMNEPANFGTNEERPWNWPEDDTPYWSLHCGHNTWDDPPYRPLAAYLYDSADRRHPLADKTLCMNAVQGPGGVYSQYDVHSLYGWSQTLPTLRAAQAATGERSLVITRSTFPGSGRGGGHWLGDNTSMWPHLRESIVGMLDFNLFGIPYIGADICGFFGNTNEELCLRWMQLGAFYPFSRNHNGLGSIEQHPGAFGDNVGIASREIMETRYWLLPYLYTLFHHAHTLGNTVVRPLHHVFPMDVKTRGIDQQFLWGPALLISPILYEGQTELRFYLPQGRWYQFYTGEMSEGQVEKTTPVNLMSKPELHMRGGHVIVLQAPANNTFFSRKNTIQVRVLLDKDDKDGGVASGSLFWDDGSSIDTYETGNYVYIHYTARNNYLNVTVIHFNGVPVTSLPLYSDVIVYGVTAANSVTVTRPGSNPFQPDFHFQPHSKILNITSNNIGRLSDSFTVSWQ